MLSLDAELGSQMPLKLYVGARKLRPEGFGTIDVDARMNPDIVADICKIIPIKDGTCDEVIANAVLEHIEWPDGFKALAELTRILQVGGMLRISVPDIASYAQQLITNDSNKFHVMGVLFGIGGRTNSFERHRFGYTASMLCEILQILGCGNFEWMPPLAIGDSSGGWSPRWKDEHVGECLNIQCRKNGPPLVPPDDVYDRLVSNPFDDILGIAASIKQNIGVIPGEEIAPLLYQRIHFELLKAGQRIAFLEAQIASRSTDSTDIAEKETGK